MPEPNETLAAREVDPNNPSWSLPAAIMTWVASLLLMIVVPAVAVLPYVIYRYRESGSRASVLNQALSDKTAILISILTVIPVHLLTLAIAWAVVTQFGKRPFWRSLGWSWGRNFGFWASAGLSLALLFVGSLIVKIFGGEETQLDQIIASSAAARYATAFLATVTAPLVEEVIYRGVVYAALQEWLGRLLAGRGNTNARPTATAYAVLGVLLLFTLVHVPQYWPNFGVILAIGLLSFALTMVRAYTGRLLPCVVIHTIFNGVQSLYIVLQPWLANRGGQKALVLPFLARSARTLF